MPTGRHACFLADDNVVGKNVCASVEDAAQGPVVDFGAVAELFGVRLDDGSNSFDRQRCRGVAFGELSKN